MTEGLVVQILQSYGPLALVVIACGYALRKLQADLSAAQAARIADAQSWMAKLLELVEREHKQRDTLMQALNANADSTRELRAAVEAVLAERGLIRLSLQPPPTHPPQHSTRGPRGY